MEPTKATTSEPRPATPVAYTPPDQPENNTEMVNPITQLQPPQEAIQSKKRGRPRMYASNGSLAVPSRPRVLPLNPMRISVMPTLEFTMDAMEVNQRGKERLGGPDGRGGGRNIDFKSSGDQVVDCSSRANFTPHIINVGAGEDVTKRVISFSQQGPQAICILSGTGIISSVTLSLHDSSGGTLTYEGRFTLLSLSGSFIPCDNGGSRSGGMSVCLSSSDGRVFGGIVAGLLVAASPVQVIVGSFLPSNHMEQKPKKPEYDTTPPVVMPFHGIPMSIAQKNESYSNSGGQGQFRDLNMEPNMPIFSSFRGENNWFATIESISKTINNKNTDINIPFSLD